MIRVHISKFFLYIFTNTFLLSAPTQVPKIQAAKSGGVSGHLVDRGLMVLDKKGKMVTGRKHPRMWLARVEQVAFSLQPEILTETGAIHQLLPPASDWSFSTISNY